MIHQMKLKRQPFDLIKSGFIFELLNFGDKRHDFV